MIWNRKWIGMDIKEALREEPRRMVIARWVCVAAIVVVVVDMVRG